MPTFISSALKRSTFSIILLLVAIFSLGRLSMLISVSQNRSAYECFGEGEVYRSVSPDLKNAVEFEVKSALLGGYRTSVTSVYWFNLSQGKREEVLFTFSEIPLLSAQWAENSLVLYGVDSLDEVDEQALKNHRIEIRQAQEASRNPDLALPALPYSARGYQIPIENCGFWCLFKKVFGSC